MHMEKRVQKNKFKNEMQKIKHERVNAKKVRIQK